MKVVMPFLLCIFGLSVSAGDLPYGKDTAYEYLASREAVYLVVKVGGWLSYNEYEEYLAGYESDVRSKWKSMPGDRNQTFLVLKNYKDKGKFVGEIIQAQQVSDYGLTELGRKYILFLNTNRNQLFGKLGSYYFGDCEVIQLNRIPKELVAELSSVLDYVSKSTLNPCLFEVQYK